MRRRCSVHAIAHLAGGVLLVFVLTAMPAMASVKVSWEDRFSAEERDKLTAWITEVVAAVETLVGPFPFDVHIRFERYRAREPVPWANTRRGARQGVRFIVDPRYPLEAFREDWTAPHELSHLILPYLGREHAWFSEGFASYMQFQVMHAMGVLDDAEVVERYRERLTKASGEYAYPDRPFVDVAPRLRAEGRYPVMYWGGAVFFLHLNQQLERNAETTLMVLLREYLGCCRRNDDELDRLVAALDSLLGSDACAGELERFRSTPGFPRYDHLVLGVAPSAS